MWWRQWNVAGYRILLLYRPRRDWFKQIWWSKTFTYLVNPVDEFGDLLRLHGRSFLTSPLLLLLLKMTISTHSFSLWWFLFSLPQGHSRDPATLVQLGRDTIVIDSHGHNFTKPVHKVKCLYKIRSWTTRFFSYVTTAGGKTSGALFLLLSSSFSPVRLEGCLWRGCQFCLQMKRAGRRHRHN